MPKPLFEISFTPPILEGPKTVSVSWSDLNLAEETLRLAKEAWDMEPDERSPEQQAAVEAAEAARRAYAIGIVAKEIKLK